MVVARPRLLELGSGLSYIHLLQHGVHRTVFLMLAECQSKSEGDLSAMHGEDNFEEWISDGEVDDGDLHDDPDGDLGASILTAHTWPGRTRSACPRHRNRTQQVTRAHAGRARTSTSNVPPVR